MVNKYQYIYILFLQTNKNNVKFCPINKFSIDLENKKLITLALKLISAEIDMFV